MESKLNTKQKILFGVMTILIILGVVVSAFSIDNDLYNTFPSVLNIVIYIVLIVYAVSAFKMPHSNFLRYVSLLFAFSVLIVAVESTSNTLYSLLMGTNALLVAYMSGRLGKLKTNIRIIWIVIVLFVVAAILFEANSTFVEYTNSLDNSFNKFIYIMLPLSKLIQFIPLSYAYVVRYHQHIEMGKKYDAEINAK